MAVANRQERVHHHSSWHQGLVRFKKLCVCKSIASCPFSNSCKAVSISSRETVMIYFQRRNYFELLWTLGLRFWRILFFYDVMTLGKEKMILCLRFWHLFEETFAHDKCTATRIRSEKNPYIDLEVGNCLKLCFSIVVSGNVLSNELKFNCF